MDLRATKARNDRGRGIMPFPALAALSWFGTIKSAMARIPWQAYIAAGLLAAIPVNGCIQYRSGYSDGRESVLAELRTAEAESLERASKAIERADKAGAKRAEIEAETRAADIEAIERAEATNANPLDALMSRDRD